MKKSSIELVASTLILLFVYTAASKLMDFDKFQGQMHNQTLPSWLANVLIWTLPEIELVVAGLLLFPSTRIFGFYASLILITLLTGYIGLVLFHVFSRVPCSCGGVLSHMGWLTHFFFNLFFLAITVTAIFQQQKERIISDKRTT